MSVRGKNDISNSNLNVDIQKQKISNSGEKDEEVKSKVKSNERLRFGGNWRFKPTILGRQFKIQDESDTSVEPTVLDTSLPHVAIYSHLKTYDLKPIEKPKTPPILSMFRSKQNKYEVNEESGSNKSSRLMASAQSSTRKSSMTSTMKARKS